MCKEQGTFAMHYFLNIHRESGDFKNVQYLVARVPELCVYLIPAVTSVG